MKHLKHLIMLLAAVCLTLTSCLDSSSDSYTPQGYGLVEVVNYMGTTCFKASNGKLIYPTAESLANVESNYSFSPSATNVAYIGYQYSSDIDLSTATSVNVTLTYAVSVDATSEEVYEQGSLNDSISTSPIIGLYNVMETSSDSKMYIMNDRYLVTGIQYYFYQYAHYFTLVCYPDEQDDDTVLKLYLRHSGNVENTSVLTTSYDAYSSGYPFVYFKAFDLSIFPLGPNVKTIEVHADVASLNGPLSNATETVYTVAYNN
jgi:hypothetical protein